MRLLHTGDLHIGKTVNDFSMLEDQRYLLEQICCIAAANRVDGILLSGDIYDRAIPTGEAVLLFDAFLTKLLKEGIKVYLISGNHDSAERISFGEKLLSAQGIGIAGVYRGELSVFRAEDEWGTVEIVLFPFIKPAQADAGTTQEAVEKVLAGYWEKQKQEEECAERQGSRKGKSCGKKRRVLVTHYFVTDAGKQPELSDSETTIHVGGLDNVDASLLSGFDYVALGHIHKPQQIGEKPIWYAGAPLKYSFGEAKQTKSVLLIELGEEGLSHVKAIPLHPLREMRIIKGSLEELLLSGSAEREESQSSFAGTQNQDYIQAVLTDKEELIDPIGTLRSVYPNIMQILREEKETGQTSATASGMITAGRKDPAALFEEFYELVKEEALSEEERKLVSDVIKEESERQI